MEEMLLVEELLAAVDHLVEVPLVVVDVEVLVEAAVDAVVELRT